MLTGLFICLTHLMTALNALNNIDIILTPHCQRILRLARRTFRPGNKTFTHCHKIYLYSNSSQPSSCRLSFCISRWKISSSSRRASRTRDICTVSVCTGISSRSIRISRRRKCSCALGPVRMHPEGDERFAPQLQRTGESFTRKLRHAGLQQLMRLNAPASAGQNMQMWKVLLTHFHQPHGIFWLITGDDDRLRLFRPAERSSSSWVASPK